ncbi:helix-turn-helix domain-containing protein [Microlunatus speluncae]|uniref:helix-turn-helix domain-containing protein n=1 Tax=Microlunatus speluncae TaxID=2594267 RepID=UPI0012662D39|nr:helix-turn-helix domain-containing protein [Microlunatus speluncae]
MINSGDGLDARPYAGLVGGLHLRPVHVAHNGSMRNISLELTPLGARKLLGVPAAELAGQTIDLDAVLGDVAAAITERLAMATTWGACCAVLDQALGALATRASDWRLVDYCAQRNWHRILASGGKVQIGDLAAESGYSHRNLREKFVREYGISPKQAARIVRFERSSELVKSLGRTNRHTTSPRPSLSEIAARSGYYDQAHMTRDWHDLAGCAPSAWLRSEDLPFVQDTDRAFGAS